MKALPEDPYERLAALLDIERAEEARQLAEAQRALSDEEAEARGESVARLRIVESDYGLGGRALVTFARASGAELPAAALDVGEVVRLRRPPDVERDAVAEPAGVVCRRTAHRATVAFEDDPPDWADGPRLRLDRVPDEVTFQRQKAALERVRKARGDRLALLRDIVDGKWAPREDAVAGRKRPAGGSVESLASLDDSQRAAAEHALAAPAFALIHGPPGTGKTTALVGLVRAAVARGERVLACAPSNAATDLLVEKLREAGVRVVRVGHPARVTPAVLDATLDEIARDHDDARTARKLLQEAAALRRKLERGPGRGARDRAAIREERASLRDEVRALRDDARRLSRAAIEKVIEGAEVVCATLTGVDSFALGDRRFDLVVIDEAAQALEPACWAAIARAERFVLAGDHCQLPPTVVSPEAARLGLARTLFERLHATPHGAAAARMLELQYRMHERIADFSSRTFYEGRLRAAPAVAAHLLGDLPGVEAVDPWTTEPLVLVDTAGAGHDEERAGGSTSVRNPGEADVVARIVRELTAAGLPPAAIGAISPYSLQVEAIRARLRDEVAAGLEVASADAFQGREREAIVFSLTRANRAGEIGFLADRRRTNVALTRARRALVVVGDGATLGADPFFADLLAHVELEGRYLSVFELG